MYTSAYPFRLYCDCEISCYFCFRFISLWIYVQFHFQHRPLARVYCFASHFTTHCLIYNKLRLQAEWRINEKKAEMITDRTIWSWLMSKTPSQTTTMHSLIRLYAIECISWLLDSYVHFEFHYYYCCYLHRSYLFHFCPVHTVCCCHSSSLAPHPFGCGQIHRRTMHRTELQWIYRYGSHLVPFFFVQSAGFGCFVLSFCEARRERVSVCLLVVFNWTINARAWCALCIHRLMACPITKSSSILLDLLYHLYLVSILPQA